MRIMKLPGMRRRLKYLTQQHKNYYIHTSTGEWEGAGTDEEKIAQTGKGRHSEALPVTFLLCHQCFIIVIPHRLGYRLLYDSLPAHFAASILAITKLRKKGTKNTSGCMYVHIWIKCIYSMCTHPVE